MDQWRNWFVVDMFENFVSSMVMCLFEFFVIVGGFGYMLFGQFCVFVGQFLEFLQIGQQVVEDVYVVVEFVQ